MGWQGAVLILIPTVNTKAEPSEMFEWELRVQAFQNSVMPAMCNRVGAEDEMHFSGESIVVDAHGNVLTKADRICRRRSVNRKKDTGIKAIYTAQTLGALLEILDTNKWIIRITYGIKY